MANARADNVIYVDTSAGFAGPLNICGIKYIGNTSGTALIESGSSASGGVDLWNESGANILPVDDVDIVANNGIYVTLANSAKIYIYLK